MSDKHAYVQSPGHFIKLITQLRRTFPGTVNAETVKKLGLAPKNEGYLINTLRFLGIIDEEGKKTELAAKVFSSHQDEEFARAFAEIVTSAYADLFELHGEEAWSLDRDQLISFFRENDQTSASVGKYQAGTFLALAALAGHGELPEVRQSGRQSSGDSDGKKGTGKKAKTKKADSAGPVDISAEAGSKMTRDFGLSVRIEINLPANGDQETYDNIFKSIRENLLNG